MEIVSAEANKEMLENVYFSSVFDVVSNVVPIKLKTPRNILSSRIPRGTN